MSTLQFTAPNSSYLSGFSGNTGVQSTTVNAMNPLMVMPSLTYPSTSYTTYNSAFNSDVNNNLMGLVPNLLNQFQAPTFSTTTTTDVNSGVTAQGDVHSGYGAGAEYVNPNNLLESLSGIPYVGFLFGGTRNTDRDTAVDAAIASGNIRSYAGSENNGQAEFQTNPIGNALASTLGTAGLAAIEQISRVPILGHNVDVPIIGQLSTFDPILNYPFGQAPMSDDQIRRNAIYNFGPRADAFENRGDSYGVGVAAGLRGTQVSASDAERIPLWDDAMDAINNGLGFVSGLNLPVISFGADALRSFVRGARGDSTYDWLDGNSRDPMDPTFTVFGAPANLAVSFLASRLGSLVGMDKEAMDYRLGRAVGDAMNVYDIFLPGDHTLHAWGSFFPRALTGTSNAGNNLHDHVHQHELGSSESEATTPVNA